MKKLAAALVAACLAAAALFAIPAFGATKVVTLKDNRFVPKALTVSSGTRVQWSWKGKNPHNVVVRRGPKKFRSSLKKKGTFTKTINTRGTYRIICEVHPGMRMTLKVR